MRIPRKLIPSVFFMTRTMACCMTKKRRLWNQPGFRLFLLTIPLLLLVCAFSYLPLTGTKLQ